MTFTKSYSSARLSVEFYKDSNVVQNVISFDSGMDVESVLDFSDFQASDSGLYYCNMTVFSDNSSHNDTSNYRVYQTGETILQKEWYVCTCHMYLHNITYFPTYKGTCSCIYVLPNVYVLRTTVHCRYVYVGMYTVFLWI